MRHVRRGTRSVRQSSRVMHKIWLVHPELLTAETLGVALGRHASLRVAGVFKDVAQLTRAVSRKAVGAAIIAWPISSCESAEPLRKLRSRAPAIRIVALTREANVPSEANASSIWVEGIVNVQDSLRRLISVLANVLEDQELTLRWDCPEKPQRVLALSPEASEQLSRLTKREREVLRLIARGMTASECAFKLDLAPSTVENHKWNMMRKLGTHRVAELVQIAVLGGLLDG
jgi:DNA-binding NarL/FixJ family response regulator